MHAVSFDLMFLSFYGVVEQLSVYLVRKGVKVFLMVEVLELGDFFVIFQEFSDGVVEEFVLEDMFSHLWIEIPLLSPVRSNQD